MADEWVYKTPKSLKDLASKFPRPTTALPEVAKGATGAVGKAIGGAAIGVLTTPTEAGAGSDKIPPPSPRQLKEMEGRAKGGPVKKGKKYLVGERGPEVFVPKKDGKILRTDEVIKKKSF